MSLDNANKLLTELQTCVDKEDLEKGKEILSNLKILMLEFTPDLVYPSTTSDSPYLKVIIETLELGVLLTISDGDFDAFGRNISQLKPYYSSTATTTTNERKCHILGLNLMHLLIDNRLSEFHSELELLEDAEATSKYVSFPINLERQLMVGMYDEVLNSVYNIPHKSYQFFMDNLLQTVRDLIADCIEVSYKTMKLTDAITIMKFNSKQELLDYVEECRDDWIITTGANNKTSEDSMIIGDEKVETDVPNDGEQYLCFQPPPTGSKASDIPSMKLISQSLTYATEMERIV